MNRKIVLFKSAPVVDQSMSCSLKLVPRGFLDMISQKEKEGWSFVATFLLNREEKEVANFWKYWFEIDVKLLSVYKAFSVLFQIKFQIFYQISLHKLHIKLILNNLPLKFQPHEFIFREFIKPLKQFFS